MALTKEHLIQVDNSKCRICLFTKQNLCPLFRHGLSMKVMKLADIKMYEGDGLPSYICLDCELEVKRCTNFIVRIQRADAKLREMLAGEASHGEQKESFEVCPENEELYQDASNSQDNMLPDNKYRPEDENEQPLADILPDQYHTEDENERPLIEIEEFNFKQEITSFDQFITEKEEVHCESDHDHYRDNVHDNDQPEEEPELNPLDHVDIVEDRTKGDGMEVSNDPLGQEEPLIETQKNESDPSFDPLTCMKQEPVPMDIDKVSPVVAGSSSSVRRIHTTLFFQGCTKITDNSKDAKIKTVCHAANTFNASCLRITADKSVGNEENSHQQKPIPDKIIISSIVSNNFKEKESFCKICDVDYGRLELLNKHKESYGFICRVCETEFDKHDELETHFQIHYNFKCSKCKEGALTRKELQWHWKEKHSSGIFKCDICNKTYSRSRNLRKHKLLEHTSSNISVECVVCGKIFNAWKRLDSHLKKSHLAYENIACELCNSTCSGPDRMKLHMRTVHYDNHPAKCETCGKLFKCEGTLKKHKESHDNSERSCGICGKSIIGKINMNQHMKQEHSSKSVFTCNLCNDTFNNEILLKTHKNTRHRKLPLPKPVFCEVCGKLFKTSQILKVHKLIHTNVRSFVCHVCGATFIQGAALRTHQRIHSTVGKYICDYCSKSFKWKQTFTKHVNNCNMKEKNSQTDKK